MAPAGNRAQIDFIPLMYFNIVNFNKNLTLNEPPTAALLSDGVLPVDYGIRNQYPIFLGLKGKYLKTLRINYRILFCYICF
jgi:hypothetical protein